MQYYFAVRKDATIHVAMVDRIVKVDLGRDEVLDIYNSLESITLFKDVNNATKHATQLWIDRPRPNANSIFAYKDDNRASDSFPKEQYVSMRSSAANITYVIEGPDEAQLDQYKVSVTVPEKDYVWPTPNVSVDAYRFNNKENLELQYANVSGVVIYPTEKYAKKEGLPLVVNIEHETRPQCNIL